MRVLLDATPADVMRAVAALRNFGRENRVDERILFGLAVALEECATNVVEHGLRDDGQFEVSFDIANDEIVVELRDRGPRFDPTGITVPDAVAGEEIREAGGWGTQLVRHYVDGVAYERAGDENILRLRKRLAARTA